jgi:hypothetical protein
MAACTMCLFDSTAQAQRFRISKQETWGRCVCGKKPQNFRCQLGDRYCQLGGQVTTGGGAPQVAPHLAQQGRHGKQLPRMPVPMPCRELGWSGSGSEDV